MIVKLLIKTIRHMEHRARLSRWLKILGAKPARWWESEATLQRRIRVALAGGEAEHRFAEEVRRRHG